MNQAQENEDIYNEIKDIANRMNQVQENENVYCNNELNNVANQTVIATNRTFHVDARANVNHGKTRENNHQETGDAVKYQNTNTTKGTSTFGSTEGTNPKVKEDLYLTLAENLYLTLVNGRAQGEDIRLQEAEAGNCCFQRKLRKPKIVNVSIGLISMLAILVTGSIWFHTNSKRLEQNLYTDGSDTPDLTTFEAITLDISTMIRMPTTRFITDPGDCSDVYRAGSTESGVYTITLQGQKVPVYCDMEHDGGWTVFHNRMVGSLDFYNTWKQYKSGFGDLEGEFWWGNEHLATITAAKQFTLRVDMSDWYNDTAYALYTNFSVAAESDKYRLTARGYTGTAGDSLAHSSGRAFSTRDRDNDGASRRSCAAARKAGGWFWDCANANPNGRYGNRRNAGQFLHYMMYWKSWKGYRALKIMSMKFRPTDF